MSKKSRATGKSADPRRSNRPRRKTWRSIRLHREQREDRITPAGGLLHQALDDTPLLLRRSGTDLQIVKADEPSVLLAARALGDITEGVTVAGNGHSVALTVDASVPPVSGGILFAGGSGTNELIGPGVDTNWHVTGPDAGDRGGVSFLRFTGVENLTGAAGNRDTFVFDPAGRLSGTVNGGAGGFDTLVIQGGTHQRVVYSSSGPDAGTIDLDSTRITYAGLEPITDTSVTPNRVFTGTLLADQIVLESNPTPGMMTIRSANGTFESVTFLDPATSLTIKGDLGDDTVSIKSVDPAFKPGLPRPRRGLPWPGFGVRASRTTRRACSCSPLFALVRPCTCSCSPRLQLQLFARRHAKYILFQLAEVAVRRQMFARILERIARLCSAWASG
jgi:hypothetical protein